MALELNSFERKLRHLRKSAAGSDVSAKQLKEKCSELARLYCENEARFTLIQRIWKQETERPFIRTYNLLLSARRVIKALTAQGAKPYVSLHTPVSCSVLKL